MRSARGRQDGEGVRGSWVVHSGEGIDIGSLARRLTLAFWRGDEHWHFDCFLEQEGRDWGLAALELDVVKRDNTNYDPT